jgi:ATP adenylyltransferase
MRIIFAPWRYEYVKNSDNTPSCVFCDIEASSDDEASLVVFRARHNFVVLNRYPYVCGHMMVVPYSHVDSLDALNPNARTEMMALVNTVVSALKELYRPHGFNVGMNIGPAAGAGIAEHIHMHVMPRWGGDTNFITVIGDTRVIPEDLSETYRKMHKFFERLDPDDIV